MAQKIFAPEETFFLFRGARPIIVHFRFPANQFAVTKSTAYNFLCIVFCLCMSNQISRPPPSQCHTVITPLEATTRTSPGLRRQPPRDSTHFADPIEVPVLFPEHNTIEHQLGDGSCLFHSVAAGLRNLRESDPAKKDAIPYYANGHVLRREYVQWVQDHWVENPIIPALSAKLQYVLLKLALSNKRVSALSDERVPEYTSLQDFVAEMSGRKYGDSPDLAILNYMLNVSFQVDDNGRLAKVGPENNDLVIYLRLRSAHYDLFVRRDANPE